VAICSCSVEANSLAAGTLLTRDAGRSQLNTSKQQQQQTWAEVPVDPALSAHASPSARPTRPLKGIDCAGIISSAGTLSVKPKHLNTSVRCMVSCCTCRTTRNIPEFKVAPELALELLMAANFLDT
jgi:hypothetical protein